MPETNNRNTLTEAVYYILISLFEPMHGYGIMNHISDITKGRVVLGAGTLYGALNTLMDKGWIQPVHNPADSRKKEYVITEIGKTVVKEELVRLWELIDNGTKVLSEGQVDINEPDTREV